MGKKDCTGSLHFCRITDEGRRSHVIDDDLVEVLLAVADELDPPLRRPEPNAE